MIKRIYITLFLICISTPLFAQYTFSGKVIDNSNEKGIEYATILIKETEQWAISDNQGSFSIRQITPGKITLIIQCMGFAKQELQYNMNRDYNGVVISLKEDNLTLDEVTVVAQKNSADATTSYLIDRNTLDNQQMLNLVDISSLLPGGKTVNSSLMNDDRMALRSESSEKGNASFGTAIEVDGMRVENNGMMNETLAASTRNISSSNIESVEIIAGIPSVEYGDLSNGVVKVKTRKGKSPFIVEGSLNQHTQQIALNKGFTFGQNGGVLNTSLEHARSFSDLASPHTAYDRNILSLNYSNTFMREKMPITMNVGITGNMGGYDSHTDPDETLDSYSKQKDNLFRAHANINWLINKPWLTNVQADASFSYQDKISEVYSNASSASSQAYIHTRQEGYYIATEYDEDPNANVILGPTGYWYIRSYNDQKPISYVLKMKANWAHSWGNVRNSLLVGTEYKGTGNNGRGTYYEDIRYAPTWREYRYDELPWMYNWALYIENKIILPFIYKTSLQIIAGLRDDITSISKSEYGSVSSLSPRFNGKLNLWSNKNTLISDFNLHAGWGKSIKLPSFQILYPAPSYSDILTFTPGSTSDNKAFYAYYTYPQQSIFNKDLKWQYTLQSDIGVEMKIAGTRLSLSAFWHKTHRPYMTVYQYTPYKYKTTNQSAIERSGIPVGNRSYVVDPATGIITLIDKSGEKDPIQLTYTEQQAYNTNRKYINGSPVSRWGLEWVVDFKQIKSLRTTVRLDGNYYSYKGLDMTLFAGGITGLGNSSSASFPLLGYYRGSSSTSVGTVSSASLSNGSESRMVNLNATITTHIPKVRLILAFRLESSLYNYKRSLSKLKNAPRGYALEDMNDYFGTEYTGNERDTYVAVYPEYYTTWDNPSEMIPFMEKFLWAKDNDRSLYNQLSRLVVKSNYAYMLNPNYISKYFSANFSITKEIGDHVSISFYANNFFNNFGHIKSTQTGLTTSLFDSGYIPKFYYGLSLRFKI